MYTDETKQLFNHTKYKNRRSALRCAQTAPEELFWQRVRQKQLGVKFRRQHGIGDYIVDFYCAECSLIIEIDGGSHFSSDGQEYDKERDAFLQSKGLTILRFTNRQIMNEMDNVLSELLKLFII
jgi:very-short-patch-repair endonuclease